MKENLTEVVYRWLKSNGYPISKNELSKQIATHPDFPSLNAVSDSLKELEIEYASLSIPVGSISELVGYFLAYVRKEKQEQLVLISRSKQGIITLFNGEDEEEVPENEFLHIWDGVIVVVDPSNKPIPEIYKRLPLIFLPSFLFILLVTILPAFYIGKWTEGISILLSAIGLGVCGLITYHELGANSALLSKFCALTKNSNCDAVLSSPAAKLFGRIGLGDIGIAFFSASMLSRVFLNQQATSWIFVTSLLAAPFTLLSV
jgi:hypothetical protein